MFYLQNSNNGLGNIIYQLLNIIYQALIYKQKINLQELKNTGKYKNRKYNLNKIFNIDEIQNNFNKQIENNQKEILKKSTFFPLNLHSIQKRNIDVSKYFEISNKFIKPYLNLNNSEFCTLDKRICLIHIRSGDILSRKPHSLYVQPPLNYYIKIINEYNDKYDKFIIITEPDMLNPCIKKLKEYSDKIEIKSQKVEDDYSYLLRAQSIVLSWSTFSDTIVYLSPNLKNLFFWNDSHVFSNKSVLPNNINVKSIKLLKPYIERYKWNLYDKKQYKLLLEYNINDIIFE